MKKIYFKPVTGYYFLSNDNEPKPVLTHGYFCTDLDGKFVFGFNTHDGGQLVELSDLLDESEITKFTVSLEFVGWLQDRAKSVNNSASKCTVALELIDEFNSIQ